jgi:hypothetical protein
MLNIVQAPDLAIHLGERCHDSVFVGLQDQCGMITQFAEIL